MDAYGFDHLWSQGDVLIRFVAVLLIAMSLSSWTVIFAKLWQQRFLRAAAAVAAHEFWHARSFAEGLGKFASPRGPNPFLLLAREGSKSLRQHDAAQGELQEKIAADEWLASNLRAIHDDGIHAMQSGMALLASIGSTAPFVGLFGTVWGIYHALIAISLAGQASIDKVAGPVGEALVMTALGLGVAIPAVLGYNALVRRNKAILVAMNRFMRDLHAYFLGAGEFQQPRLPALGGAEK